MEQSSFCNAYLRDEENIHFSPIITSVDGWHRCPYVAGLYSRTTTLTVSMLR